MLKIEVILNFILSPSFPQEKQKAVKNFPSSIRMQNSANEGAGSQLLLGIIQLVVLYNAQQEGWEIKHIFGRTFELSKLWTDPFPFGLENTLDKLMPPVNELESIRDTHLNAS